MAETRTRFLGAANTSHYRALSLHVSPRVPSHTSPSETGAIYARRESPILVVVASLLRLLLLLPRFEASSRFSPPLESRRSKQNTKTNGAAELPDSSRRDLAVPRDEHGPLGVAREELLEIRPASRRRRCRGRSRSRSPRSRASRRRSSEGPREAVRGGVPRNAGERARLLLLRVPVPVRGGGGGERAQLQAFLPQGVSGEVVRERPQDLPSLPLPSLRNEDGAILAR